MPENCMSGHNVEARQQNLHFFAPRNGAQKQDTESFAGIFKSLEVSWIVVRTVHKIFLQLCACALLSIVKCNFQVKVWEKTVML